MDPRLRKRRLLLAGALLGAGLAGIVSEVALDGARFAERAYAIASWLLVLAGLAVLWSGLRDGRGPGHGRLLAGSAVAGAGLLGLLEGLVLRPLLDVHPLPAPWGVVWNAVAFAVAVSGWVVVRETRLFEPERPRTPRPE